jgi:hypothetical protein
MSLSPFLSFLVFVHLGDLRRKEYRHSLRDMRMGISLRDRRNGVHTP